MQLIEKSYELLGVADYCGFLHFKG